MDESACFVEVVFPLAIPKCLTYSIPAKLPYSIQPGSLVVVSLGNKKILTAVVIDLHQRPPVYKTKPILDVLEEKPVVNTYQLEFFKWMAAYYMCTLGEVFKAALPSGFKLTSQSQIYLHPYFSGDVTTVPGPVQHLIQRLANKKGLSYHQVEQLMGTKMAYQSVKELLKDNTIVLREKLQEKYIPKKEVQVSLGEDFIQHNVALQDLFQQLEKRPKQLAVLLQYMSCISHNLPHTPQQYFVSKKQLLSTRISNSALQTLVAKNIFIEKTVLLSRIEQTEQGVTTTFQPTTLSPTQTQALREIEEHFSHKMTVLLHGIPGSGKTEIYAWLIQQVLEQGGQVLYLLPEIGLTTQIVQRLKNKFQDTVGVYHSKYGSNERVEIWNALLQDKIRLIVGARSALFLPFSHLQLVIVDEEHEAAYKQADCAPRYHGRDAALMLAHYHQANVLLGSATPSIETYYKAQKGKYALVQLTEKFQQTNLPRLTLVNMRTEQEQQIQGEFSNFLIQALQNTLQQQEQALIFQNRRGYAAYLLCQGCAWIPTCAQCSVSLTYHQYKDCLVCHYCGYHCRVPAVCSACQAPTLKNKGFGTEKIEESLQQLFPDKKIQRMDLETTRRKNSYQKIITNLEKGHTAILVGTQMITKGLDFGGVTLVGVVDIDGLLHFPDFRAHERCFQLIMQVSGRAGRRGKQGHVIIQTKNPDHPLLVNMMTHDYTHMYQKELLDRQKFRYPPYVRLIKITCQHANESLALTAAQALKTQVIDLLNQTNILGPQPPLIAKVKNIYRVDIWLKLDKMTVAMLSDVKQKLGHICQGLLKVQQFRTVGIIFDVDPC